MDGPGRAGGGRGGGGAGGAGEEEGGGAPKPPFEKPDFGLSGALAEDAGTGNVYNGVLLKFSEPPEARPPTQRWRLHVFKVRRGGRGGGDRGAYPLLPVLLQGDTQLEEPLHVHRQSAYLAGRDRRVADIPTDHPSCSSQHAVLQYRLVRAGGGGSRRCCAPLYAWPSTPLPAPSDRAGGAAAGPGGHGAPGARGQALRHRPRVDERVRVCAREYASAGDLTPIAPPGPS